MRARFLLVVIALAPAACTSAPTRTTAPTPTTPRTLTTAPTPTTAPATTRAAPTTPTTIDGPPYAVTETTLHLVDPTRPTVAEGRTIARDRVLTTLVWLPAGTSRRPLVVFAHGFQVGPAPYTTLLEAWAAHGYVVAAPEFPLTDQAVAGADLDESDIDNQPADVRFVTDYLVSPASPVADRIDADKVAVAGHSDGAETALAAGTDALPAGEPGYHAVIAMGVQPVPGAAGRNPPMLVTQGDADTINPPSYGYQTWALAASPKYLLVLAGGGHLTPLEAGSAYLPGIEAATEAFLDVYVAGDARPSAIASAVTHQPSMTLRAG